MTFTLEITKACQAAEETRDNIWIRKGETTMIRDRFSENIKKDMSTEEWLICQDTYDPQENLKNESLFALSNGYLGIRGSFEEGTRVTLPYLYVNGVFDKSETFMRELAALPNWLGVRLYVEKELIGIENCEILEFSRVLDMKHAVLYKQYVLKDKKGRVTKWRAAFCQPSQCTPDGNRAVCDSGKLDGIIERKHHRRNHRQFL